MNNLFRAPKKAVFTRPENQSAGILDDHAVRKTEQTIEFSAERTLTTDLILNLNADLLDGHHASEFALSGSGGTGSTPTLQQVTDQGNTTTNSITLSGGIYMAPPGKIMPISNTTTAINISQADGTNFVTFDSTNKRVGIGVTPLFPLHVAGSVALTGDASTDGYYGGKNRDLKLYAQDANDVNDAIRFYIDENKTSGITSYVNVIKISDQSLSFEANNQMDFIGTALRSLNIKTGDSNDSTDRINFQVDTDMGVGTTNYVNVLAMTNISGGSLAVGTNITNPSAFVHQDFGTGAENYYKFTSGTTTGQTASDGFNIGLDISGNAIIRQFENLPINFYTNNNLGLTLDTAGKIKPLGYLSSDGTAGATGTITLASITSIVVKDGLITSWS